MERIVERIFTLKAWHSYRVGGYRQVEYACDFRYKDGVCVGNSGLYYTGRYR